MTEQRRAFTEFLRRVAANSIGALEWERFVATHYADGELERIRRELVRLAIGRGGGRAWSDSERAAFELWIRELGCEGL